MPPPHPEKLPKSWVLRVVIVIAIVVVVLVVVSDSLYSAEM